MIRMEWMDDKVTITLTRRELITILEEFDTHELYIVEEDNEIKEMLRKRQEYRKRLWMMLAREACKTEEEVKPECH